MNWNAVYISFRGRTLNTSNSVGGVEMHSSIVVIYDCGSYKYVGGVGRR